MCAFVSARQTSTGMSDPEDEEDELPAELPYLHRPTYAEFLPYMVRNQPVSTSLYPHLYKVICIIVAFHQVLCAEIAGPQVMLTGLMDSWGIRRWVVRQGGEGARATGLDVEYLRRRLGQCVVPVSETLSHRMYVYVYVYVYV